MRLSLLSIFATIAILTSCSSGKSSEQASLDTTAVSVDTAYAAMPESPKPDEAGSDQSAPPCALDGIALDGSENDPAYEDSLPKYFTPEQIIIIKKAKKQYANIKTSVDMAGYFPCTLQRVTDIVNTQIEVITPTEYSGDDSPDAKWKWFGEYYPGFYGSVECSECSYDIKVNLQELIDKSHETTGDEDDVFFDMCWSVYGSNFSMAASIVNSEGWYQLVGCDFCAASLLGSNKRLEILQKIEQSPNLKSLFGANVEAFQDAATREAFPEFFALSKREVLDELNGMLKVSILTPEQRKELTELRQNVQANKAEFDCATKDCKFPEN